MIKTFALLSLFLIAGCANNPAPGSHIGLLVKGFPDLPADARQVVERVAQCHHWAGEIGDNSPERREQIYMAVATLRCERIKYDVMALRSKYPQHNMVYQALAAAENW